MKVAVLSCGLGLVVAASVSVAHRLDEYLQATRIAITPHRIDLTFELTPGVAVAGHVLERLDLNRDGRLSDDEGKAYAGEFLKDLTLALDGKAVPLSVTAVTCPALPEIRSGTGIIQIRTTTGTNTGLLGVGPHVLSLTNGHMPAISVYLVNALQSKEPTVEIGKQIRNEMQNDYRLEFRVRK